MTWTSAGEGADAEHQVPDQAEHTGLLDLALSDCADPGALRLLDAREVSGQGH